jgi:flagellin-like protein
MLRKLTKRRAVSPVIATVILVAVAITVAVAVSYWMSGITSQYTSFEKVEIQSAICTYEEPAPGAEYWKIVIILKNSGTKTATITNVFVNEVAAVYVDPPVGVNITEADCGPGTGETMSIVSGASDVITVGISNWAAGTTLTSGTTINIKIHSAAGMDYIKLVQLV